MRGGMGTPHVAPAPSTARQSPEHRIPPTHPPCTDLIFPALRSQGCIREAACNTQVTAAIFMSCSVKLQISRAPCNQISPRNPSLIVLVYLSSHRVFKKNEVSFHPGFPAGKLRHSVPCRAGEIWAPDGVLEAMGSCQPVRSWDPGPQIT